MITSTVTKKYTLLKSNKESVKKRQNTYSEEKTKFRNKETCEKLK